MNEQLDAWLAAHDSWEALQTVAAYPLPIRSAAQLREIRGCGPRLAMAVRTHLEPALIADADRIWSYRAGFAGESVEATQSTTPQRPDAERPQVRAPRQAASACHSGKKLRPEAFCSKEFAARSPETVDVLIDSRERGVHQSAEGFASAVKCEACTSRVDTLPVGDIGLAIVRDSEEWLLPVAIERKSKSDLASSILDSRYKRQKWAMKHFTGVSGSVRPRCVYVVQDEANWSKADAARQLRVATAIVSTEVRDGFCVVHTGSAQQTVSFAQALAMRVAEGRIGSAAASAIRLPEWKCLHAALSEHVDFGTTAIRQLRVVKGVQIGFAQRLVQRQPSLFGWWRELKMLPEEERERVLSTTMNAKSTAAVVSGSFTLHKILFAQMNFTLRVVGFPQKEFRLKGIRREEAVANIVNFIVRELADAFNAGEPDDRDESDSTRLFWSKISESPYFIADPAATAVDISDDTTTVGDAFRQLDTGVLSGEVGWIGFRGVFQHYSDPAHRFHIKRRDLALLSVKEFRQIVALQLKEDTDDVLLDYEGHRLTDDGAKLFCYVDSMSSVALNASLRPCLTVEVEVVSSSNLRRELSDQDVDEWFNAGEFRDSVTLREILTVVTERHGATGPGFVDWENFVNPSNVALLHPDTQLLDLVGGPDDRELTLTLVRAPATVPSPFRQRIPLARVKLEGRAQLVDVPLLPSPFLVSDLLNVLHDQGFKDFVRRAHVRHGHDVLDHSTNLWTLMPQGIAPVVLLSIE